MKVIQNIELLKKLHPILEDVETEYICTTVGRYTGDSEGFNSHKECFVKSEDHPIMDRDYKTLTLEEAIELLPEEIYLNKLEKVELTLYKRGISYDYVGFEEYGSLKFFEDEKTLLEAIEQMLEYLIDNNLLEKGK